MILTVCDDNDRPVTTAIDLAGLEAQGRNTIHHNADTRAVRRHAEPSPARSIEQQTTSNIDRMNLIATRQAEAAAERIARESEHRAILSRPALPDTLASLYSAFRGLREKVKPERVPPYKLVLRPIRTPSVAALEQREAQRLDGAVRRALTEQAPRFVPDWDEGASLPPNDELLPGIPVFTADAKKIAEFLDAKMVVLRRIIAELREGR
jgi:hypothetical protein